MGRAYSIDLRERVVAAVETGGLSCHRAAAQFGVGVSTAIRWVERLRKTGSVAPSKIGGYKPRAIAGEHRAWLLARIREKDFTLLGLVTELAERGLKVDYRSVWTFVHDEKLSSLASNGYNRPVLRKAADVESYLCGLQTKPMRELKRRERRLAERGAVTHAALECA